MFKAATLIAATASAVKLTTKAKHWSDHADIGCLGHLTEGERGMVKDNHMLGKFMLDGIPPAPRGVPQIEVTFNIDANGILNVTACDKASGKSGAITITNDKGRLTKEEIEKLVADAERYKAQDEKMRNRIEMKTGLESYCYQMRQQLDDEKMRQHFSEKDKALINGHTNEVLMWLGSRAAEEAAPNQFATKQRDLEQKFNPIMMRVY